MTLLFVFNGAFLGKRLKFILRDPLTCPNSVGSFLHVYVSLCSSRPEADSSGG